MSFIRVSVIVSLSLLATFVSSVHANDARSKIPPPLTEFRHGMIVKESDIFVGRDTRSGTISSRGLGLSTGLSYWANGIIPYQFHSDLSDQSTNAVLQAIDHWNSNSTITLVNRNSTDLTVGSDYIEFVTGPGCASWVGRQGQVQEIWVSDFCTSGSMIHEIGHALGLLHEHTRSDRDLYLSVQWDNIQPEKTFNFELSGSGTTDLGSYDYDSIMHYGEYFFSNTDQPTLVPIGETNGVVIGQRARASAGDLASINRMYAADLSVSAQVSDTQSGTAATLIVTNNHFGGAHDIVVSLKSANSFTGFSATDDAWNCAVDGDTIACRADVMPGSSTSSIFVSFNQKTSLESIAPVVSSKTFDLDLTNNSIAGIGFSGELGQAVGDDQGHGVGAAKIENVQAAGSFDQLGIVVLMLLMILRRESGVLRSRLSFGFGSLTHRIYHAFACFTTSPGRTSGRVSSPVSRRWSLNNYR